MQKEQLKVLKPMKHEHLYLLHDEKSTMGYEFVEKRLERMANGFTSNLVVFKEGKSYFKFLAISYLDDEIVFTVPYQVFPEKEIITRMMYSNWVSPEKKLRSSLEGVIKDE